jgi:hypothetical protein
MFMNRASYLLTLVGFLVGVMGSSARAEDITISGLVRTQNGGPVANIEITVYRNMNEVADAYTGQDGKYTISFPGGDPITMQFDTHWSLTNSRDWHPSVVANMTATQNFSFDRVLLPVGAAGTYGGVAEIDALSGYLYGALLEQMKPNKAYAGDAAFRLSQMKMTSEVLSELQKKLEDHFRARAEQ